MRELSKKLEASCNELTEEMGNLTDHLSALERAMKRQEQTVKSMDQRVQVGGIKQIRPPVSPGSKFAPSWRAFAAVGHCHRPKGASFLEKCYECRFGKHFETALALDEWW